MEIETTNKILIPIEKGVILRGYLEVPSNAQGLIIFSHGSGSSSQSPRNSFVAQKLNQNNMATLLTDLLTEEEDNDEIF